MKTMQDIKNKIEELAVSWGEALIIGDYRNSNKYNKKITKIVESFKADKILGESILIPLLNHPNPSVRLHASVHALELEIHIQEAEGELTNLANNPDIHVIGLTAKINLAEWQKKKKAQPVQKDE